MGYQYAIIKWNMQGIENLVVSVALYQLPIRLFVSQMTFHGCEMSGINWLVVSTSRAKTKEVVKCLVYLIYDDSLSRLK